MDIDMLSAVQIYIANELFLFGAFRRFFSWTEDFILLAYEALHTQE